MVFLGLGFNLGQFHTNKAICGVLQKCLSVWVCQCVCLSMCVCVNKQSTPKDFRRTLIRRQSLQNFSPDMCGKPRAKNAVFPIDRSIERSIVSPFRRCSLLACNNYNYNYLCVLCVCVLPLAWCVQGACNTKFMYKCFSWDWPSLKAKPGTIFNILQFRYNAKKNSTLSANSLSILFTILHNLLCSTVYRFHFRFVFIFIHIHNLNII